MALVSKEVGSSSSNTSTSTLSWSNALTLLEQSTVTSSLTTFLSSHLDQLRNPANPFPSTSKTSSTALVATSAAGNLSKGDQAAAKQVSERFELAQAAADSAVKSCVDGQLKEGERLGEEEWDKVTAWVFEERMAVIQVVSFLLRIHEDPDQPCYSLAEEHVPSILSPTFASSILTSLAARTTQTLPLPVRQSASHSKFWTTQLVLEQKALLELLFLVYYSPSFPLEGGHLVQVLETIRQTQWGSRQELFGYLDDESQGVVRELEYLYNILAIEVFNLESIIERADSPYPVPAPGESPLPPTSPFHPSHLSSINSIVESLVQIDGERASPILLGWAFVLSRVTESLLDRGVPNEYHEFAQATLRVETGSGNGGGSSQPLFQYYASHALSTSSALFPTLLNVLRSPLFGLASANGTSSSDPNTIGYLSVIRGLLLTLPHLVRLPFLAEAQLSGLFETFSTLYANPSSSILCAQFWEELSLDQEHEETSMILDRSAQSEAEREIIDLAKSRFPVQFGPFAHIARSLSAGLSSLVNPSSAPSEHDELLASRCARSAFIYLSTLPTLTHIVPSASSTLPLPYESLSYPDFDTGYSVRCTRPIRVSQSLSIKEGTMGRLVSPPGRKPVVVAWDVGAGWSAWQLMGDVLTDYAGLSKGKKRGTKGGDGDVFGDGSAGLGELPIEWESDEEKERDLVAVLDLFTLTLRNDPSLGTVLVDHLSSTVDSTRPDLIEVLFRILDRSLGQGAVPAKLVSFLIELIASLLPSYPGVVWTFLRGSSLLFPSQRTNKATGNFNGNSSTSTILANEKLSGQYPVTLSLLTLLQSLVLESQVSSCVTSPEYRSIKEGVLVRALNWVKEDVWSVYSSWRFAELGEKFELARRIVEVYKLVLEEGELEAGVSEGQFSPSTKIVVDAFLFNTSTSGISQLLPLLSTFAPGPDSIILLRKAGRYNDAMGLEDLVDAALGLTLKLLRLRTRVQGSTSSLLEKLVLSQNSTANLPSSTPFSPFASTNSSTGQRRSEILESIASLIVSPLSTSITVQAAKVVSILSSASNDQAGKNQVSMIALLGGSERAEKLVVSLLSIVEDPNGLVELQTAVWDLIAALVDSKPGLATLLVTGRQYPFSDDLSTSSNGSDKGKGKELTATETASISLAKSLAPPPHKPLSRTAIGVGLETVGTWKESWQERPAVLVAVLRFFDYVWQHISEYGVLLDDFRSKSAAWNTFVDIAFEDVGSEPVDDEMVEEYCQRVMAKAHAVRIIALDIELALERTGAKAVEASSFKAFADAFKNQKKLLATLTSAISSSCAPDLHQGIYSLIRSTFAELDLDSLRQAAPVHPLDDARSFGSSYIFSLPLIRRKLDGFMADRNEDESTMVGPEAFADVVEQTARLNCNFSLLEAQISGTRSWRQILEVVLPLVKKDSAAQTSAAGVHSVVAKDIAEEDRAGQVMSTIQSERLEILSSLVEITQNASPSTGQDSLVDLLCEMSAILNSETLEVLACLSRRSSPAVHSTALRITFYLVRQLNSYFPDPASSSTLSTDQKSRISSAIDSIIRTSLSAVRDLFVLARSLKSQDLQQDLALSIAVTTQILRSSFSPSPALWLAHCHSLDLFRSGLEVFVHMEQLDAGRPLYAQDVLDFLLAVATSSPRAAEQLALEGVMTALTNNALTSAAESGAINLVALSDGSRTPQHEIWTSMLAVVVALVSALGESTRFVEQDVTGFVRLYGAQIAQALSWTSDSPVMVAGLEETAAVVSLMHGLARASARGGSSSPATAVAAVFVDQSLNLLQHLVYALLHPNHLSSSIEPTSPEERNWLEKEAEESDLAKKPVAAAVTVSIVQLVRDIVGSLIEYSDAWKTLVKDPTEWRCEGAVVLPTATVTSTEQASIGTLLDLVSYCTDTVRSPPSPPAASPAALLATFPTLPFSSTSDLRSMCSDTLEATLLLASTQLGLYGKIGSGPQSGQKGASFARTLSELATELTEGIDKAVSAEGGGGGGKGTGAKEKKWLLLAIKHKIATWI